MSAPDPIPADAIAFLARRHGLAMDDARIEALRARTESLLSRLAALGRTLPQHVAPAPTGGTKFPR